MMNAVAAVPELALYVGLTLIVTFILAFAAYVLASGTNAEIVGPGTSRSGWCVLLCRNLGIRSGGSIALRGDWPEMLPSAESTHFERLRRAAWESTQHFEDERNTLLQGNHHHHHSSQPLALFFRSVSLVLKMMCVEALFAVLLAAVALASCGPPSAELWATTLAAASPLSFLFHGCATAQESATIQSALIWLAAPLATLLAVLLVAFPLFALGTLSLRARIIWRNLRVSQKSVESFSITLQLFLEGEGLTLMVSGHHAHASTKSISAVIAAWASDYGVVRDVFIHVPSGADVDRWRKAALRASTEESRLGKMKAGSPDVEPVLLSPVKIHDTGGGASARVAAGRRAKARKLVVEGKRKKASAALKQVADLVAVRDHYASLLARYFDASESMDVEATVTFLSETAALDAIADLADHCSARRGAFVSGTSMRSELARLTIAPGITLTDVAGATSPLQAMPKHASRPCEVVAIAHVGVVSILLVFAALMVLTTGVYVNFPMRSFLLGLTLCDDVNPEQHDSVASSSLHSTTPAHVASSLIINGGALASALLVQLIRIAFRARALPVFIRHAFMPTSCLKADELRMQTTLALDVLHLTGTLLLITHSEIETLGAGAACATIKTHKLAQVSRLCHFLFISLLTKAIGGSLNALLSPGSWITRCCAWRAAFVHGQPAAELARLWSSEPLECYAMYSEVATTILYVTMVSILYSPAVIAAGGGLLLHWCALRLAALRVRPAPRQRETVQLSGRATAIWFIAALLGLGLQMLLLRTVAVTTSFSSTNTSTSASIIGAIAAPLLLLALGACASRRDIARGRNVVSYGACACCIGWRGWKRRFDMSAARARWCCCEFAGEGHEAQDEFAAEKKKALEAIKEGALFGVWSTMCARACPYYNCIALCLGVVCVAFLSGACILLNLLEPSVSFLLEGGVLGILVAPGITAIAIAVLVRVLPGSRALAKLSIAALFASPLFTLFYVPRDVLPFSGSSRALIVGGHVAIVLAICVVASLIVVTIVSLSSKSESNVCLRVCWKESGRAVFESSRNLPLVEGSLRRGASGKAAMSTELLSHLLSSGVLLRRPSQQELAAALTVAEEKQKERIHELNKQEEGVHAFPALHGALDDRHALTIDTLQQLRREGNKPARCCTPLCFLPEHESRAHGIIDGSSHDGLFSPPTIHTSRWEDVESVFREKNKMFFVGFDSERPLFSPPLALVPLAEHWQVRAARYGNGMHADPTTPRRLKVQRFALGVSLAGNGVWGGSVGFGNATATTSSSRTFTSPWGAACADTCNGDFVAGLVATLLLIGLAAGGALWSLGLGHLYTITIVGACATAVAFAAFGCSASFRAVLQNSRHQRLAGGGHARRDGRDSDIVSMSGEAIGGDVPACLTSVPIHLPGAMGTPMNKPAAAGGRRFTRGLQASLQLTSVNEETLSTPGGVAATTLSVLTGVELNSLRSTVRRDETEDEYAMESTIDDETTGVRTPGSVWSPQTLCYTEDSLFSPRFSAETPLSATPKRKTRFN